MIECYLEGAYASVIHSYARSSMRSTNDDLQKNKGCGRNLAVNRDWVDQLVRSKANEAYSGGKLKKFAVLAASATGLLAACGGGGDEVSTTTPTA